MKIFVVEENGVSVGNWGSSHPSSGTRFAPKVQIHACSWQDSAHYLHGQSLYQSNFFNSYESFVFFFVDYLPLLGCVWIKDLVREKEMEKEKVDDPTI